MEHERFIPEEVENYALKILQAEYDRLFKISEQRTLTYKERLQFTHLDEAIDILNEKLGE